MVAGGTAAITLKIINPTMNDMTITVMDLPTAEEEKSMIEEMRKTFDVSFWNVLWVLCNLRETFIRQKSVSVATKSSLTPSIMRPSLIEDPRPVNRKITGKVEIPDSSFVINQRDDSAEFDDDVQGDRQEPR